MKLILGDCLEKMKDIPDGSIDLVLTDPPYKIIAGGVRVVDMGDKTRDYSLTDPKGVLGWGRMVVSDGTPCSNKWLKRNESDIPSAVKNGKMFDHNDIPFSEWLPEVYRVLKRGTHCYIMINARNLRELQTEAESVGFVFQNLLIWDKGNKTPNKYYMQQCEFILMLSKRPARNINNMGTGTLLSIPNIIGSKVHPTEKPTPLLEILIRNSSNVEECILDPFMGSGTTGLACAKLGRHFIGMEIDKTYFDIAKARIEAVQDPEQPPLI